ncbi:hypothetical protein [Cohnella abietis]|uniref:Lipoprotein n=1 Tax=Cohnella abietis TaxID=2507935 RepID=A0A3T1CZP1_9BACL|nr:hypothetical protein [Cohnella abietis]BBI31337.1 hypothetical protein KCTCHS21_07360 [Cohnella abietis]
MTIIKLCTTLLLTALILSGCSTGNNSSEDLDQIQKELKTIKEENDKLRNEIEAYDDIEAELDADIDAELELELEAELDLDIDLDIEAEISVTPN